MDEVFGNSSGETVVESPLCRSLNNSTSDSTSFNNFSHNIQEIDKLNATNLKSKPLTMPLKADIEGGFEKEEDIFIIAEEERAEKKLVDLNTSVDFQVEQNEENHQLEHRNGVVASHMLSEGELCDIKSSQTNNLLESYVKSVNAKNEIYPLKVMQSPVRMDTFHPVKQQRATFSISNYQKSPRQTAYQLPLAPQVKTTTPGKMGSPQLFRTKIQPRPRAQTTASLAARHLYQNLPVPVTFKPSPILRQTPRSLNGIPDIRGTSPIAQGFANASHVYMNVPHSKFRQYDTNRCDTIPPWVTAKESYTQVWSAGGNHKSLSDTECDDVKKHCTRSPKVVLKTASGSSPRIRHGYVQMTSPYVRSPVSSVYAQLSTTLASYAGQSTKTIFCPLCPRQFSYEKSLANHIQRTHRTEMETMINGRPGDLGLQVCPLCQAKFFDRTILPRHLMDCHRDRLVQLLERNNCMEVSANCIQCPFCSKAFSSGINGEHMLLFHVNQSHYPQYEAIISKMYLPCTSSGSLSVQSMRGIFGFDPGVTSTPGLSKCLNSLIVMSDSKRKLDDVEKEEATWKKTQNVSVGFKRTPKKSVSKGILRQTKTPSLRPNVKRELRFSVPHVTKEEIYFPESPGPETPDYVERVDLNVFSYPDMRQNQTITDQNEIDSGTEECDFNQQISRKRRRLGLSIRSRNIFKCREKDNENDKAEPYAEQLQPIYTYAKSYKRPKPIPPPQVPTTKSNGSPCAAKYLSTHINHEARNVEQEPDKSVLHEPNTNVKIVQNEGDKKPQANPMNSLTVDPNAPSLTGSLHLCSPLRMFKCNSCRIKFCENDLLLLHISQQHRSLFSLLRPQFGCGVCAAKFYENKYLVKHCLQQHASLLEAKTRLGEEQLPFAAKGGTASLPIKGRVLTLQAGHLERAGQPTTVL